MRLIDADALKSEMLSQAPIIVGDFYKILELVDNAPAICNRPRGKWTEEFDESANPFFQRRWRCSACNDYNYYGRPDFCPCCGADMRKEGDENDRERLGEERL